MPTMQSARVSDVARTNHDVGKYMYKKYSNCLTKAKKDSKTNVLC